MHTHETWTTWTDPPLEELRDKYQTEGLTLSTPGEIAALDQANPADLQQLAAESGALLQEVFQGNYPLTASYAMQVAEGVREGTTNLFTLRGESGLTVATAAIVHHANDTTGNKRLAELGRACKSPFVTVSAKPFLRSRVTWAEQHLPEVDFLYSSVRSAGSTRVDMQNGRNVQGVWWGNPNGIITAGGGWDYTVGDTEPFTCFVRPMHPTQWTKEVTSTVLFVPSVTDARVLQTFIGEATKGQVVPGTEITSRGKTPDIPLKKIAGPSGVAHDRYVVTAQAPHQPNVELSEVNEALREGVSQKLVVEADVATTPAGALIMAELQRQGWTTTGWEPSEQFGICPVLRRINPTRLGSLVMPGHLDRFYKNNGLAGTQQQLDTLYTRMLITAASQPGARLR
ncbi:MAG TPA: hypothetical protein VJ836_01500 [Candidatus Saccharimonadales bacterium]|nr:hypothetical protein [Candidatus Saccharimonadales bacterium]